MFSSLDFTLIYFIFFYICPYQGISAAAQTTATDQASWESKSASSLSSNPPLISKTVEYGHRHGMSRKTEHLLYYFFRKDPGVLHQIDGL